MGNQGGVYTWSQTPAANATADNTVNWQEGQAPSSINDSARAMMASVAKFRDDISGSIVTTGTSTAYIVSSNQQFDSASDFNGKMIAFTPHVTNGPGPVTVTVDGFANLPLRSAPNVELPSGVVVQGTPYMARFNQTDNALYLANFHGNPYNIPIGGGLDYWGASAPNSSFVFPFGQAISRTTYATLFGLMGTTFGVGDGSTTFNLPDKRGRVSVSQDNMGGTAANRVTTGGSGVNGDSFGAAGGAEIYTQQRSDLPNVAAALNGTAGTVNVTLTSGNIISGTLVGGVTSGSGGLEALSGGAQSTPVASGTFTPQGTVNLNGGVTQTAIKTLPPAIIVPYIMRII